MIDFEVLDVEAERVGVSPELQAVSARLPHRNLGRVDALQVEDVSGRLRAGVVVAELDTGSGRYVVRVEGEAVVGEIAGCGAIPQVRAVEARAALVHAMRVPAEVLADLPDCSLKVVVID